MKFKDTVDCEAFIDAKLAENPIAPRADFAARVCGAIAEEKAEAFLREQPLEASADFADRVMAEIAGTSVVAFPRRGNVARFLRFAATGTAVAAAFCLGIFSAFPPSSDSLRTQVSQVLAADSDLAEIVAPDDFFSYEELVAASRILTVLNETTTETAELFAYYEN